MMLPPELLIQIFELCSAQEPFAVLKLAQVCRAHKAIVDSTPSLWNHLIVPDDCHSLAFWYTHAQRWIERSQPLRLHLHLQTEHTKHILPLLAPFISALHRCAVIKPTTDHRQVLLHSVDEPPTKLCVLLFGLEHINARPLNIDPLSATLRLRVPELPPVHLLPATLPFTALYLSEFTDSQCDELQPLQILKLLRHLPYLRSFEFHGWLHEYEPHPPAAPVHLPRLDTLVLTETCLTRSILSHIHAPSLHTLVLNWLNIGFALDEYESFSPGDSDDESFDPSQSPSSDHLTGMGLRKLISRYLPAVPPLTHLVMDMSDMRTKDFHFCFDHLDLLEEFMISGSDMSDKVVMLLKPYSSSSSKNNSDSSLSLLDLRVRLPRLVKIVLRECQMLNGDVIMETFSERVRFTDAVVASQGVEGSINASMQHVGIIACTKFSGAHALRLGDVLGPRLHLGP